MDMVLCLSAFVQPQRQNLAAKEGLGGWRVLLWAWGAPRFVATMSLSFVRRVLWVGIAHRASVSVPGVGMLIRTRGGNSFC